MEIAQGTRRGWLRGLSRFARLAFLRRAGGLNATVAASPTIEGLQMTLQMTGVSILLSISSTTTTIPFEKENGQWKLAR
jgi:hypothetical protein